MHMLWFNPAFRTARSCVVRVDTVQPHFQPSTKNPKQIARHNQSGQNDVRPNGFDVPAYISTRIVVYGRCRANHAPVCAAMNKLRGGNLVHGGDTVRFKVADIFLPTHDDLPKALATVQEIEGVVTDFSDSGLEPRAF